MKIRKVCLIRNLIKQHNDSELSVKVAERDLLNKNQNMYVVIILYVCILGALLSYMYINVKVEKSE